jgi:hypothetical protein
MRRRLVCSLTAAATLAAVLSGAGVAQASPGHLRVLLVSNDPGYNPPNLVSLIQAEPGVAVVNTFDAGPATPAAQSLTSYDLVVDAGDDSYPNSLLWGNELAKYLKSGGALIQFAYDNWNRSGAAPGGEFQSDGLAPFVPGPNPNLALTLGSEVQSPLLTAVPTFSVDDNTAPTLASGATLLAKWSNATDAIATKGRVESISASLDTTADFSPLSAAARLILNAGNVLGLKPPVAKITKSKISSRKHSASFTFKASGIVTGFKCALVKPHKRAVFSSCKSGKTYKHLNGKYTFEVRGVNRAGTQNKPASKRFTL